MKNQFNTVDAYIAQFSSEIGEVLVKIRAIIRENAPEAHESIAYGMPAYKTFNKPLVYFAAYPKHIGFYATPAGHEKFATELSKYHQGKGSVQFPLHQEIPYELIAEIVKFRVEENKIKSGK